MFANFCVAYCVSVAILHVFMKRDVTFCADSLPRQKLVKSEPRNVTKRRREPPELAQLRCDFFYSCSFYRKESQNIIELSLRASL